MSGYDTDCKCCNFMLISDTHKCCQILATMICVILTVFSVSLIFSGSGYLYEDDGISIDYQLNNNSYNNFTVSFTHTTTE